MNAQIPILTLSASLLGLVIINIILGSITSFFNQQFDKVKFIQGIIKGLVIVGCFIGVIEIGQLTPNLAVINVDGKDLSLANGTYLILLGGYYYYGKQVLIKMSSFISGNYKITDTNTTNVADVVSNVIEPTVSPNEQGVNNTQQDTKPVVDAPTPPIVSPTPKENTESQTS